MTTTKRNGLQCQISTKTRSLLYPDIKPEPGVSSYRMAKVKVSGCFRTMLHAKAWCRGSSYLTSMAALSYNPLVATQIALDGKAADIINEHYDQSEPN